MTWESATLDGGPSHAWIYAVIGVQVNVRNKAGRTALELAVMGGFAELVALLITKGADVADMADKLLDQALQSKQDIMASHVR